MSPQPDIVKDGPTPEPAKEKFTVEPTPSKMPSWLTSAKVRNLVGFWFLGLTNNFGYVVMLSAAHDLLKNGTENVTETDAFTCNPVSTGAILLADILPSLLIKLVSPFFFTNLHARVIIAIAMSCTSFVLTSVTYASWMTYVGVISAAISSGLGEVTFLRFSSHFESDTVASWSSGTGGAGVLGSFLYAAMIQAGLSPRVTLQLMLLVPFTEAICFWILIQHPPSTKIQCCRSAGHDHLLVERGDCVTSDANNLPLLSKIGLIKPLLKYMIPLSLVYFFEYFINQGLTELVYFPGALVHKQGDQYRWFSVLYQVGVFISRSSVKIFAMKRLWILAVLQGINVVIFLLHVIYKFIPSIWGIFALILFEGLLGGCAYVSTFYRISKEIKEEHREFSMGVASVGDAIGITLAALLSLPVHDALCKYLLQ